MFVSFAVAPSELEATAARHGPSAFVLTVGDDGRPRVVHVAVTVVDGVIRCTVGRGAAANAAARPNAVTVLWMTADDGFSLIADGAAVIDGEPRPDTLLTITVTSAVRHRPAPV